MRWGLVDGGEGPLVRDDGTFLAERHAGPMNVERKREMRGALI